MYFRLDYNGHSDTRGKLGSNMPMEKNILEYVYKDSLPFPDPGICIFSDDHQMIDQIYWKDNPNRILHYYPDFDFNIQKKRKIIKIIKKDNKE